MSDKMTNVARERLSTQHQLDLAGLILDVSKGHAALLAPGNQASCDGDLFAFFRLEVGENRSDVAGAIALRREGVESEFAHRGDLVDALLAQDFNGRVWR